MPGRYEASITTLENTKDLSKISLEEGIQALQAQEQRRLMREESKVEGVLAAKQQNVTNTRTLMDRDQVQNQPMQKEIGRNVIRLANTTARKVILHLDVVEDLMLSTMSVIKWGMKLLFAETRINYMVKLQGILIRRRSTCLLLHVSLALNLVKISLLTVVVIIT